MQWVDVDSGKFSGAGQILKICTDITLSAYVILTEDKLNNN